MSVPSPVIVIFGITGDLSRRKLLPALYHLLNHDLLGPSTKIIGTSRSRLNEDELLKNVELCVLEEENVCDPVGLQRMHDALEVITLDPKDESSYDSLAAMLDTFDNEKMERDRLMYMSIPPSAYMKIVAEIGKHDLNDDRTRLLVEKPFGNDTKSAKELINAIQAYFYEEQIYRIDHYLAKETAQNLLAFRMHNPIFTSLWSGQHIKKIQIRAAEKIGVENRIDFYENTGALRDIIQGHLLQLLAIIMMDQPADDSSMSIHEGKEAFLASLAPIDPKHAIRGQYDTYREEVRNDASFVETYARVELSSQLARWQDTKIVLETGKALDIKETNAVIEFSYQHERRRNVLRFDLQPNEGISLDLIVKKPGFDNATETTNLDFSYEKDLGARRGHPDAYERVIMDAAKGDRSLFATSKEVELSWKVVQPLLDLWSKDDVGLITYNSGSKNVR